MTKLKARILARAGREFRANRIREGRKLFAFAQELRTIRYGPVCVRKG